MCLRLPDPASAMPALDIQKAPNFLIIGAPKAGTTSLWAMLRACPGVFMPENKEPAFFLRDAVFARGNRWYLSLFAEGRAAAARGEATTEYSQTTTYPHVPARIAEYLPHARLIYMVRNPLETLASRWLQELYNGKPVSRCFPEALRACPELIDNALYWQCVSDYRRYFADEQLQVLFFEDFRDNPTETVERCLAFLGLDPTHGVPDAGDVRNRSLDKDMFAPAAQRVYQSTGYRLLRRWIPDRLRGWARRRARVPLPKRPAWDDETLDWVWNRIGDDTRAFLSWAGKPPNYWNGPH
jgi:hypothetical protein